MALQHDHDGVFTRIAASSSADQMAADAGKLIVQFYAKPVQDAEQTQAQSRPIFKEVEYVKILVPGDKENIIDRPAYEADKERFPKQYERFLKKMTDVADGTPLGQAPIGISTSQVEELRFFHITTVEGLAGLSDEKVSKFMGLLGLRQRARDYLQAAKDASFVSALRKESDDKDERIKTLEKANAELQTRIAALEKAPAPQHPTRR